MKLNKTRRSTATLLGVAFGDAMGRNTEFVYSVKEIVRRNLVVYDLPRPALVTDDTDMTRYVCRALLAVDDVANLENAFVEQFIDWYDQMDSGRKPGSSCIRAVRSLIADSKHDWLSNTDPFAKGCGANMRVAPVALDTRLVPDFEAVANVAQLQSAITHAHPTALAAAELTAYAIWLLRWENFALDARLLEALLDRCDSQRGVYREDVLGDLAKYWSDRTAMAGYGRRWKPVNAKRAMQLGWDEVLGSILDVYDAYTLEDVGDDVCSYTGGGWIAEEALAGALLAALWHPENPVRALMRAATTSGDSDSLASIAGALHGACYGYDAWPHDWYARVEFGDELAEYGERWD